MTVKKTILASILLVFLSTLIFSVYKVTASTTKVSVDPPTVAVNAGDNFNVNINVTDISNFTCWQLNLYYLKSILNCTGVAEGPFLTSVNATYFGKTISNNYNSTHGSVLAYSSLLGSDSANGSGVIVTVTFKALGVGNTLLHLTDIQLGDEKIPPKPIDFTAFDGTVYVSPGTNHDVAVTSVIPKKTIAGKGYTCNVSVVTENHGGFGETYNVTLRANETEIATRLVSVQVGAAVTIDFTWNTSGYAYGGYIMSAYAWPVSGETNTLDNNCTDGQVLVLWPGDIRLDYRKIDMKDIAYVARRFGLPPSDPLWDPNADLNNDGKVDMKDVGLVARYFGLNY